MRYSIDLSDEINEALTDLAEMKGYSRGEIIKRALSLYIIGCEAEEVGVGMGLIEEDESGRCVVLNVITGL